MGFKLTVEIPLFFSFLGFFLTSSVDTNLMIYRTCYVTLGLDKHDCSLLGNTHNNFTKELEKLVQPKADVITMVKTSMDSFFAAVLCLVVGAWSDRFGRKPVLVVNLLGYIAMMLFMVVFSAIEDASPWYMLTCSIPVILTGGGASLLTVLLAYLSDITSEEQRGFRMGIFEGFMALAVLIGTFSSSYIFNATSYAWVYLFGAISVSLGLFYTLFFIPESLESRETEGRIRGLFKVQNVSGIFKTTFQNRPGYNRAILLLTMFALALYFVIIAGDGSVMFLFMRAKFDWTLKQYTWYNTSTTIMWIIGTIFMVWIVHHILKVKESWLMLVGFLSLMFGMIIQGLAQVGWLIYIAALVKLPSGGISPMTRSLLSKSVNPDEVAKIFSVFNIANNLLGLVGAPVYTLLYNATLNTDPGIFNFVTASGDAINSLCILAVLMLQAKTTPNDQSRLGPEESIQNVFADDSTNERTPLLVNS